MQQLLKWTLDTIREEESCFSWMEEYRYEWAPLVKSAVSQTLNGKTALIVTDESHEWFGKYISNIGYISNGEKDGYWLDKFSASRELL